MRTQQQVVERIKSLEDGAVDYFGHQREVLYPYLDFTNAKQFLNSGAEKEQWEIDGIPLSPLNERIKADMQSYISFAWDKALHHRGLSANRSIDKIKAWLWLLEDEELLRQIETEQIHFQQYGAPILAAVCAKYGFASPSGESAANMMAGKRCHPDCAEGCGA